jgi:hypothetical protein
MKSLIILFIGITGCIFSESISAQFPLKGSDWKFKIGPAMQGNNYS